MTDQQRMIRGYDHFMVQRHRQRYYGKSGHYNFGYWGPALAGVAPASQRDASDALIDRVVTAIPVKRGHILDVACGMGGSTERLTRYYPPHAITAINLSPAQLALAAERVPGAAFRVMDASALDFSDASFDAILCVEAAFHFDTRARFLAEAHRVLKPGGTLTLSDVLNQPWVRFARPLTHVPSPNLVYDVAEYAGRFAAAGFTDIAVADNTEECLGAFCRNLTRWPQVEHAAGRMGFVRMLSAIAAAETAALHYRATIAGYLLASGRKAA
jgi:MPBQ/MSBQ methyltransferase